jgi:uncharacterized membrane protein
MDKYLVVGFDNELKAYEGSRALQDLQDEGSINLYAKVVIVRDASGKVTVKQEGDMGPVGTAVGLLTGSLVGLIGGPVGVAVGATAGMFGGLLYDTAELGVSEDFLAEVWEEWMLPVDTRMEALGGIVFRRSRNEVLDIVVERDVEALEADLADLETEYNQATGEAKVKLQEQIEATKAKLHAIQDGIQTKIEASHKETEAKIESLQEQAAKESGEQKAKREARIAELKADQKRRSELLKQAQDLIKEALAA